MIIPCEFLPRLVYRYRMPATATVTATAAADVIVSYLRQIEVDRRSRGDTEWVYAFDLLLEEHVENCEFRIQNSATDNNSGIR